MIKGKALHGSVLPCSRGSPCKAIQGPYIFFALLLMKEVLAPLVLAQARETRHNDAAFNVQRTVFNKLCPRDAKPPLLLLALTQELIVRALWIQDKVE